MAGTQAVKSNDQQPSRVDLSIRWKQVFGVDPPRYASISFMTKALDHDAQCKRAGGLDASTTRALKQIASGKGAREVPLNPSKLGTVYVREWNGRTYHVEAVEAGYQLDERIWPSLSAIAKHITGTTWSGPRFFGLTKVRSTAA